MRKYIVLGLLAAGLLPALTISASAQIPGERSLPIPSIPALPTSTPVVPTSASREPTSTEPPSIPAPKIPSIPGLPEAPSSGESQGGDDIWSYVSLALSGLGYFSAFWSGRKIANIRNDLKLFQRRFSNRFLLFKQQVKVLIAIPVTITWVLAVVAIVVKKGRKAVDDPVLLLITAALMAAGFYLFNRINQKNPDKFRTRKAKMMMKWVGRTEGVVQSFAPGLGGRVAPSPSPAPRQPQAVARSATKPPQSVKPTRPTREPSMDELKAEFAQLYRLYQQGRIPEAEYRARRARLAERIQGPGRSRNP